MGGDGVCICVRAKKGKVRTRAVLQLSVLRGLENGSKSGAAVHGDVGGVGGCAGGGVGDEVVGDARAQVRVLGGLGDVTGGLDRRRRA